MPRLVRVEGLGVVRFPDLLPAHEVSRAINTHLATRPPVNRVPIQAAAPRDPLQGQIPEDAGLRGQTLGDKLRQAKDQIGRIIAPFVGLDFNQMADDEAKGLLRQIMVFHGSPHKFDTFDVSKVGTGEGNQAFGHGLYFAENPSVAQTYAGDATLRRHGINAGGHMYEAHIPDEAADKMLDWDRPFSQQPAEVKDALNKLGYEERKYYVQGGMSFPSRERAEAFLRERDAWPGAIHEGEPDTVTGGMIYRELAKRYGHPDIHGDEGNILKASELLRDAGIPGIRYLDQGSRAAGEGSHNFVVFHHDTLGSVTRQ